jgi:hypothetical protein
MRLFVYSRQACNARKGIESGIEAQYLVNSILLHHRKMPAGAGESRAFSGITRLNLSQHGVNVSGGKGVPRCGANCF